MNSKWKLVGGIFEYWFRGDIGIHKIQMNRLITSDLGNACNWEPRKMNVDLSQLITSNGYYTEQREQEPQNQNPFEPLHRNKIDKFSTQPDRTFGRILSILCMRNRILWKHLQLINWKPRGSLMHFMYACAHVVDVSSWSNKCINKTAMMNNKYKYSLRQFTIQFGWNENFFVWHIHDTADFVGMRGGGVRWVRFSHGDEVVLLAFGRIMNVSVI